MISQRVIIVSVSASFDAAVRVTGDTSRSRVQLDLPAAKIAETAQTLRALADELEGEEPPSGVCVEERGERAEG